MRTGRYLFGGSVGAVLLVAGLAQAGAAAPAPENEMGLAEEAVTSAERLKHRTEFLRPAGVKKVLRRDVELAVGQGATADPKFTSNLPVGERGATVPVQTVDVDGGRVDAYLSPSDIARGVLLQGPDKILGISTQGHMTMVVQTDTIIVAAVEGDVLIGQESKFKPLRAGRMRVFSRATGQSSDVELPPQTSLASDSGLSVALTGSVDVTLKTPAERPIRLALIDELDQLVTPVKEVAPGQPLVMTVPRAGVYYAVARELGEGGIGGPLSAPLKIQVLGLAPGQAPPTNGVFLLHAGERVRLAGTEGLEVRYGNSPTYVPATSSIGLGQARATRVEFRNPKAPEQKTVLNLAPRYMKKVIELGPSGARWPGNPVKLRVGLWDGSGKLLRDGEDMKVRVTVNSARVPVHWRTTRSGLITSIPKQQGEGPWVVRVNVFDKKGRTIARDFLEVASK